MFRARSLWPVGVLALMVVAVWLLVWLYSERPSRSEQIAGSIAICLVVSAVVVMIPKRLRKAAALPATAFVAAAGLVPLIVPPATDDAAPTCRRLGATPALDRMPGHAATGVTVTDLTYDLRPGPQMRFAIAGRIEGQVDASEGLYVFRNEAPDSETSTDPPVSGRENFYMSSELLPDEHGCFGHGLRNLIYRCGSGLRFHFYVALVDRSTLVQLEAERNPADGYPRDRILDEPGITFLDSFEVPTGHIEACR